MGNFLPRGRAVRSAHLMPIRTFLCDDPNVDGILWLISTYISTPDPFYIARNWWNKEEWPVRFPFKAVSFPLQKPTTTTEVVKLTGSSFRLSRECFVFVFQKCTSVFKYVHPLSCNRLKLVVVNVFFMNISNINISNEFVFLIVFRELSEASGSEKLSQWGSAQKSAVSLKANRWR